MIEMDESKSSKSSISSRPVTGGGGIASLFSANEPKPVKLDHTHVRFTDVRGCDEAKEELEEIVLFLKDPKKFKTLGGKLPKGALLVGPPGCGKTMLAKAIAKEAGVSFFYCSGSEFDEMFVGVGARRIRDLFSAAKNHGPSLIFIDEIDAIGSSRTMRDMSYTRMTLNQLLSEMDGFNSADDVIVIGATNTPDSLDKALTRPGRFDRIINVDPPDVKGRKQILDLYLSRITLDPSKTISEVSETVARGSTGFTGADLQNLVNLAAIRAVMVNRGFVAQDDMEYARDRVMMGAENHSKKISDKEKHDTAYHEGGHALVAMLLEKAGADPVHKATIVPRGSSVLGLVQQLPEGDRYSISRQQMTARITIALAGRAAEDIILGQDGVTSGAMSDFQQATRLARNMIRRFGFNNAGLLGHVDYETADTNEGAQISEKTKQQIEEETRQLVMNSYQQAKDLLTSNRVSLDRIAQGLLEFETLSGAELRLLTQNPKEDIKAVFDKMRKEGKVRAADMADRAKKMRAESIASINKGDEEQSGGGRGRGVSIPILTKSKT
jgi:ATP-dependent metalloprotease